MAVFGSEPLVRVRARGLNLQKCKPMKPANDQNALLPCWQAASLLLICRSCLNINLFMFLLQFIISLWVFRRSRCVMSPISRCFSLNWVRALSTHTSLFDSGLYGAIYRGCNVFTNFLGIYGRIRCLKTDFHEKALKFAHRQKLSDNL